MYELDIMFQAVSQVLAYKKSNRFIRSGECFLRVHNFPLAYKAKFKRPAPDQERWDEKFKRKEANKKLHGVLKQHNNPSWFNEP